MESSRLYSLRLGAYLPGAVQPTPAALLKVERQGVSEHGTLSYGLQYQNNHDFRFHPDPSFVRWEQPTGKRLKVVEWAQRSPRKHEWKAWSEPAGAAGRHRTLNGSKSTVGQAQVLRELENFFEV